MRQINDEPAFPCTTGSDGGVAFSGMSLRDYFAATAGHVLPDIPNVPYFEALVGRPFPGSGSTIEKARFWADCEAIVRFIKADAMIWARDLANLKPYVDFQERPTDEPEIPF